MKPPYPDPRTGYQAQKNYEYFMERHRKAMKARNICVVLLVVQIAILLWRVTP